MATIFKIWFPQREPHPEMWLLKTVTLFSVPNLSVSLGACWHTCSTHLSDTSLTCFLFYTDFSVFPLSYALQCRLSLLGFTETLKAVNQENFVFLSYRPWQVYNLILLSCLLSAEHPLTQGSSLRQLCPSLCAGRAAVPAWDSGVGCMK